MGIATQPPPIWGQKNKLTGYRSGTKVGALSAPSFRYHHRSPLYIWDRFPPPLLSRVVVPPSSFSGPSVVPFSAPYLLSTNLERVQIPCEGTAPLHQPLLFESKEP